MARNSFTTTIDDDIQKKFKAECSTKGDKMNDVLEAFMKSYIDGDFEIEKEVKFVLKKTKK